MPIATDLMQIMTHPVLARWNDYDSEEAAREVLPCCGSQRWAQRLVGLRPFADPKQVYESSDRVWSGLDSVDWQEAFDSHPRIGEQKARAATSKSLVWSAQEQRTASDGADANDDATQLALAEGNKNYEEKFGHIFIVCASGRSAGEILSILNARLERDAETEWLEAGEQQRQITQLRLRRWLGEG
jgi:2-oxo-4-hydroxy-4-carboxy-5-ureidoimidazoline decarboxylase